MTLEICTNCGEPTGRAGRHEDSLYAGDFGPYCDECWEEVPNDLAEGLLAKQREIAAKDAEIARLNVMAYRPKSEHHKKCACARCVPF